MRSTFSPPLRAHLARPVGMSLALAGLLRYESYGHRQVFDRWSYTFTLALLGFGILWALTLISSARKWRDSRGEVSAQGYCVDLALLAWGAGYLLASLDRRDDAGRLLDFNFVGSTTASAALLEWLALALLFVAAAFWALPRLRHWSANGLLVAFSVGACLIAGEGIARCVMLVRPQTRSFGGYSTSIWLRRHAQLNRDGFRDVDHDLVPSTPRHRLLIIGDSFAYGWGIDDVHDRFGEQVGSRLTSESSEPWEAMNASAPGKNTLTEIDLLRHELQYHPEIVVLLYVFNDIEYLRPVTLQNVISEAPESFAQRAHPLRVLYKNSYLFQELYVRMLALRGLVRGDSAFGLKAYEDSAAVTAHLKDLTRFVKIAEQAGATAVVVPFDPAVAASRAARERDESFARRAIAAGVPILSVEPAFLGRPISQLTLNALDSHPSVMANHLAAATAVQRLEQRWYAAHRHTNVPSHHHA